VFAALVALGAVCGGAVATACGGGEGVEAPYTLAPDEDAGDCPSSDAMLGSFQRRLEAGDLDPLRPHVELILVQERGLATALAFAQQTLPALDPTVVPTLGTALRGDDGRTVVDTWKPTLFSVVDYLHGSSVALPGPHDEPLAAAHSIITNCDAPATVQMLRDVLALQVRPGVAGEPRWVHATPEAATSSWLYALVEVTARATQNPTMDGLLQSIEVTDDQTGGVGTIRVGRAAFLVLTRLLAANIAAPDFDTEATRALLEDVLLPRLQADVVAQALMDELLDLFGVLASSDSAAFPALQELMACVDRHDGEAAIPGMIFDFLTTDEVPVRALLADLAEDGATDAAGQLRLAGVALLDAVLTAPAPLGDVAVVIGRLLEPVPVAAVLDVIVGLRSTGVFTELLSLVDTILVCKRIAP